MGILAPDRIEWQVERIVEPLQEIGTTPCSRAAIATAMLIERDGWVQNTSRDHMGRRCVGQAWIEVHFPHLTQGTTFLVGASSADLGKLCLPFDQYVRDNLGAPSIVGWNDSVARSQEQVIEMLMHFARSQEAA